MYRRDEILVSEYFSCQDGGGSDWPNAEVHSGIGNDKAEKRELLGAEEMWY